MSVGFPYLLEPTMSKNQWGKSVRHNVYLHETLDSLKRWCGVTLYSLYDVLVFDRLSRLDELRHATAVPIGRGLLQRPEGPEFADLVRREFGIREVLAESRSSVTSVRHNPDLQDALADVAKWVHTPQGAVFDTLICDRVVKLDAYIVKSRRKHGILGGRSGAHSERPFGEVFRELFDVDCPPELLVYRGARRHAAGLDVGGYPRPETGEKATNGGQDEKAETDVIKNADLKRKKKGD